MIERIKRNKVLLIFIFGIVVQIFLMPFRLNGDMINHDAWGKFILEKGPGTIYSYDFDAHLLSEANYPPLMLWTSAVVIWISTVLRSIVWQLNIMFPFFPSSLVAFSETILPFTLLFKLLILLSNAGIATFVYFFITDLSQKLKKVALVTVILLLFNPALIYGTTMWGQIDILPIFFIIASIYFLFYKKYFVISSLLMITSLLFKQTTIIFIPIYLLAVLKYFGWKKSIISILIMTFMTWLMYAPFVSEWSSVLSPFTVYLEQVQFASDNTWVTKFAWNVWYLFVGYASINDTQHLFLGFTWEKIGFLLTFLCLLYIGWRYWKTNTPKPSGKVFSIIYAFFLISFASFLFLTRLHERHSLHVLLFMVILYLGNKFRLIHILFFTFFVFANLFFIWHPLNIKFEHSIIQLSFIRLMIVGVIAVFIYYIIKFYQYFNNKLFVKDKK